ncbi:MAG: ATP-binding protein [Verrucomicrobiota bacterium]
MTSDSVFGLEKAGWPAFILDTSGKIHRANAAAASLFGSIPKTGHLAIGTFWAAENATSVDEFLARLKRSTLEAEPLRLRTKAGQTVAMDAYVSAFVQEGERAYLVQLFTATAHFGEALVDSPAVTPAPQGIPQTTPPPESAALESSLAQRQKLECALQLTRTVALDFNNALTSILGHTSFILSRMEAKHPWRSSLLEIEKSAEKAAEVASDLAAFSRQDKDTRSQVAGNLNSLVRRTVELFQGPGTRPVAWALELEPRLYTVTFEEAKLQQAFAKILDNAVQASKDRTSIVVRTRNHAVTGSLQDGNVHLNEGHYVCVEFEDAGCGIPPEVLPRIFEPFFTTKRSPNHRGLGLAWVYGIVTNHGGSVAVSSQVGRGTSVRVYLPAQKKIIRDRTLQTDNLSGTETILMIDDEELLLTMGEMVLSSFGYRVLTASSGFKALELFSQYQQQIDLVITDLVMPRMSGRELIEQLRRICPKVRIICSSGYIRALNTDDDELYLQKPFTSLDLLRKVKQALTSGEASS